MTDTCRACDGARNLRIPLRAKRPAAFVEDQAIDRMQCIEADHVRVDCPLCERPKADLDHIRTIGHTVAVPAMIAAMAPPSYMDRAKDQAVYSLCRHLREIGAITVKTEPGHWREEVHVIASIGVVSEGFAKAAVWNSGLEKAAQMLESERSKYTLAKRWKGKRDLLEVLIAMLRAHKAKLKEGNRHAD